MRAVVRIVSAHPHLFCYAAAAWGLLAASRLAMVAWEVLHP